jgi:hypothetical protein
VAGRINHQPDVTLAHVLNLPKDEARVGLIPDSLFGSPLGASSWGANWWQIRRGQKKHTMRNREV